jgi:DNA-binding MarR family transcriptional regulator
MEPTGAMLDRGRSPRYHLEPGELRAWVAFLRAHAAVTRALESDLAAHAGMSLADYEVLVLLANALDRRLRMSELADRVLLSRSGVTRLVDRLARDGFVAREHCPSDARGAFAVLTPPGLARLREATPVHLAGVRGLFLEPLDTEDLEHIAILLERIAGGASAERSP